MLDSLAYWNGDVLLPGTMLGDWDGATLTEIPYPLLVIPDGYASVADMLEADFAQARQIDREDFLRAPAILRVAMHVAKLFAPIL